MIYGFSKQRCRGFSLVELMIIVAILGILASMVYPKFQGHINEAKCSAAKENLRIYRNVIDLYASQHNGVPPGYIQNDMSSNPQTFVFILQLTKSTKSTGQTAEPGTSGYPLGPYFRELPMNPFNQDDSVNIISNAGAIKPLTKEIRLDWPGTDSKGVRYYDY
jgi:prepilin-type N-terminal cleavage/methylation domain-containing protein